MNSIERAVEAAKKRIFQDLKDQVYIEEEENIHPKATRRAREKALLHYIQSGDVAKIRAMTENQTEHNAAFQFRTPGEAPKGAAGMDDAGGEAVQVGTLSEDRLRQAIYLCISGITLITRAAIDGGVPEHLAFAISDCFIREITTQKDEAVIESLMSLCTITFTENVFRFRHGDCSFITRDCCEYIQRHLHDPLTVNDLAKAMHRSPGYLSSLFVKELGIRPTAYIRKQKLEYAAMLLENTRLSVYHISELLSFPSASAFIRYFKEEYGCTPALWRDKMAGSGALPE